jgi:circadian clock protein KaiC
LTQEAQERAAELAQQQELERKQRTLARRRAAFEAELTALRAKFEAEQADLATGLDEDRTRVARLRDDRQDIAASRRADTTGDGSNAGAGK